MASLGKYIPTNITRKPSQKHSSLLYGMNVTPRLELTPLTTTQKLGFLRVKKWCKDKNTRSQLGNKQDQLAINLKCYHYSRIIRRR